MLYEILSKTKEDNGRYTVVTRLDSAYVRAEGLDERARYVVRDLTEAQAACFTVGTTMDLTSTDLPACLLGHPYGLEWAEE